MSERDPSSNPGKLGPPLLWTKLHRPQNSPNVVQRDGLLRRLSDGVHRPATLISAPAGFGKSVLASSWLDTVDFPHAWVSLDELDNDLTTFLSYVTAAIQATVPDLPLKTHVLLQAPTLPSPKVLARYLLNDLQALDTRLILVLDDVHRIESDPIFALLTELLAHPSPALHIVLISRWDPPLPVAALRARDQITEIRTGMLRFTQPETGQLLKNTLQRPISDDVAAAWTERTEGWVAALHLATVSMRHRGHQADLSKMHVHHANRYIQDYLLLEVMATVPNAEEAWLLRVSLLDRFCMPLCEAICGPDDSETSLTGADFLHWLERLNLFLISLDDTRQWFRLHHLFQSQLQNQLRQQLDEDAIATLYMRAARWFADNHLHDEAIRYAIAADDTAYAIDVFAANRHQLMNVEDLNRLQQWISWFPDSVLMQSPVLLISIAHLPRMSARSRHVKLLVNQHERIHHLLEALPADAPGVLEIRGELACLRAAQNMIEGHSAGDILKLTDDALAWLPTHAKFVRTRAIGARLVGHQMLGNVDEVARIADKAIKHPTWTDVNRAKIFLYAAHAFLLQGALLHVIRYATEALTLANRHVLYETISESRYLLAMAHYLRNDLDAAEQHAQSLANFPDLAMPLFLAQVTCILAKIDCMNGYPDRAETRLQATSDYFEETNNLLALHYLVGFKIELVLDRRDRVALHRLRAEADGTLPNWFFFYFQPEHIRLRLLVETATPDILPQVSADIDTWLQHVAGINRVLLQVYFLGLQAITAARQGDLDAACQTLVTAVKLGEPGGFIRTFTDLGPQIAQLLHRVVAMDALQDSRAYIERILAAFPTESAAADGSLPVQVDALTEREFEILRLLAGEQSTRAIADQLSISLSTLRTHTKNIYSKLAVHSRHEAAQRASELQLFDGR